MARPVVGNPFENQIPTVSPTAAPVETYVRPSVKKSPFEALANTLSNLERKATPALEREFKRRADKEFAEGQELYNKTRTSIGEAVKNGIIEEGASPYLRKGYRIANLNVLSSKFATELELELSRRQLYKNGNPAAAEAFAAKFAEEFRQREGFDNFGSTEVAQYFLPAEQKTRAAFISSWKTKHVAWQREQNYLAFENEVATYTNDLFKPTDDFETKQKKTVQLQQWLTGRMAEAELDGMSRKRINDTIVSAVMVTAQEQLDTDVLNILDGLQTGTGTLGSSLSVRSKTLSVTNQINNAIAQQDAAIAKTMEAERKATVKQAKADLLTASMAMYNANPEEAEQAAEMYSTALATLQANGDADGARTWINFSREMEKAGREDRKEDELASANLFAELQHVETRSDAIKLITNEVAKGTINFNTAQGAMGDVVRRFKDSETAPTIDYLKSGSMIKDEFATFESTLESKDQFGNTGNQKFVNTVMNMVKDEYRTWLYSQESTPTEMQKLEAAREILGRAQVAAIPLDEEIAVQQQFEDVAASRNPQPEPEETPAPAQTDQGLWNWLTSAWISNNGGAVPTPNN